MPRIGIVFPKARIVQRDDLLFIRDADGEEQCAAWRNGLRFARYTEGAAGILLGLQDEAGRLEQALQLYDRSDQSAGLREEIDALKTQIAALQRQVSETDIGRKLRNAIDSITA